MLLDNGRWAAQYAFAFEPGTPALFLDRDGVIVEEVHFLSKVEDVRLVAGIADAIIAVKAAGFHVVVVTNQSGVGRGLFDWDAFVAVNNEINARLAHAGARVDAVFACGASGLETWSPTDMRGEWRKPGAGMLMAAAEMFTIDLAGSFIIGDRVSDIEAGRNAGLAGGWMVLTGYGSEQKAKFLEIFPQSQSAFAGWLAPDPVAAVEEFLRQARRG